jgi:hypothetical protein
VLRSLSLFSPAIVFAAAALIAVTAVRAWGVDVTRFVTLAGRWVIPHVPGAARLQRLAVASAANQPRTGRAILIGTGVAMTVTAAALAWVATARYFHPNTYLVLILLGGGLLIMTWPTRADRHGRFPYALAILVAAVCSLWAASMYANAVGIGAAENLVRGLPHAHGRRRVQHPAAGPARTRCDRTVSEQTIPLPPPVHGAPPADHQIRDSLPSAARMEPATWQ